MKEILSVPEREGKKRLAPLGNKPGSLWLGPGTQKKLRESGSDRPFLFQVQNQTFTLSAVGTIEQWNELTAFSMVTMTSVQKSLLGWQGCKEERHLGGSFCVPGKSLLW